MANRIPIKAIFTGSDVTSLGEFASSDTIDVSYIADGTITAAKLAADTATQAELDTVSTVASAALPKAGGAMTGAITTNSTFDTRDVATDGTKLDTVETNADVTDTLNVTSAGALMDSEVTNLADVKAFDTTDYATAAQGTTADAALPKAGGAMTGNITMAGTETVDGRDLSVDGAKLDLIDASADVTDATTVAAAGALMDSEVTNLAAVKAFAASDYATAAQGTTANAALPKAGGTMTGNIVMGTNTIGGLKITTTATDNIGLGSGAVDSITTGDHNIGIGDDALTANTEGDGNIAIGYQSLYTNAGGDGNTALGYGSLKANTGGDYNTAVGNSALANTTGGTDGNTAVGWGALAGNLSGSNNVAMGKGALYASTSSTGNTALGYNTLISNLTAAGNTAVGHEALFATTGANNTAVGTNALEANIGGANNIALGYLAGDNITTGDSNIIIGASIDAPSATADNQLNIGGWIYGSGGNIGIGVTTPTDALEVSGNIVASGNLTVNGTTTTVSTTNMVVSDKLLELANGQSGTPSGDLGIVMERGSSNNAFIGWDESADKFIVGTGTFTGASTGDLTITTGTLVANIEGNITGNVTGNTSGTAGSATGNAATATALATARTIGGTSFDGTANIAVGLAGTATALATARTLGGVSFDGTANINLPGVNAAGNQSTSGLAATATALATGRTIGMTGDVVWTSASFDGSGNVTASSAIQANAVDTTALGADCVTAAKIGDNVINSEHYAAASIDNEHLADDAVGVAELSATGTASSSTFLRGDNSWVTPTDTNTTYSVQDGELSENNFTDADHSKLNGIASSANNYTHPTNYAGDDFSVDTGALTGATVVSDIDINVTTDTSGHVTDANGSVSTRTLTLANLGYTGSTSANNYSHPSYNGDDFSIDTGHLSGATVIDDIDINVTTDSSGHVTDANGTVATRNLTLADLGYSGATNANYITNNNQLTNGAGYITSYTNTTYSADGNYGMTLSGTAFRLEDDRRRNSSSTDIYSGNTHDYTFYDASHGIRWYTAGSEEMRLENDGDLHVDGDVIAYSTTVSDERLKTGIMPITNALSKVNQLNGCTFTYTTDGKESAGLIAQDVEKVLPSAVTEKELPLKQDDGKEYKVLQYDQTIGLLVEAIKELTAKVEELENK